MGLIVVPVLPAKNPTQDAPLEDQLSPTLATLLGLPGDLVRPRWQPEPPNQPALNADWVAFSATADEEATQTSQRLIGTELVMIRQETVDMFVSAYGPNAYSLLTRLNDCLQLGDNRAALQRLGIDFTFKTRTTYVPSLVREINVRRADAHFYFSRLSERRFNVGQIESASGQVINNAGVTTFTT